MKIKDLVFFFFWLLWRNEEGYLLLRVIFDYLIAITSPFFSEDKYTLYRKSDIIFLGVPFIT